MLCIVLLAPIYTHFSFRVVVLGRERNRRERTRRAMETAICGRVALSPNHVFHPKPGDKYSLHKQCTNRSIFMTLSATGPGKGGGVLDRPVIEKTTPGRESEFDLRKSRKMAPPYRVMLHNDNYNKREYVVQVLMKVIPGMTVDNAVNIMQEAHYNGLSVVIICDQADAEEHCMQLRGNGLLSSIEPASGGC
ncbi:ATP-dependent Clp protease adapter protein CLPS1, chloroplastic [Cornus florida]|uniref:ATP-dependent Clp protease adapter protein CLPS1, chloroplastic n=1 Tax=Cornus florida TaxID=4283 RepID=UPI002897C066|nr:ATP-dependent Clp protease adapter protein CLPS1, chloroplastic [Cornus florida]